MLYMLCNLMYLYTHINVSLTLTPPKMKTKAKRVAEMKPLQLYPKYTLYIYRYTHSIYISNCTGSGAKCEALTHLRREAPVQFHVICNCCDASTWALGGLHSPTKERESEGRQGREWDGGVVYAIALLPYSWETFT